MNTLNEDISLNVNLGNSGFLTICFSGTDFRYVLIAFCGTIPFLASSTAWLYAPTVKGLQDCFLSAKSHCFRFLLTFSNTDILYLIFLNLFYVCGFLWVFIFEKIAELLYKLAMQSVDAREAISVYPTTEEIQQEKALGSANQAAVVRLGQGGVFGDHLNQAVSFDRSVVYPDPTKAHRSREDIVFNTTYRSTFTNLNLPLQPAQLTILNSVGVLKYLAISMTLPANVSANVTLPRGWGIYLIDHVDFLVGGTSIQMYGQQIAQWYFHHCESQEQLDRIYALAGEFQIGAWASGVPTAYVLLPLPWCIPGGPWALDTSLLQANNIQVTVYLNSITTVAGGSGAAGLSNSLLSGNFYGRTGQYTNPARDSVLGELVAFSNVDGDTLVESNVFQQMVNFPLYNVSCVNTTAQTINLTGFNLSRRLKGIVVSFIQSANRAPAAGSVINPSLYEEVSNLVLTWQGRQLINTFTIEESLMEALQAGARPQMLSTVQISGGPAAPYTHAPVSVKIYRLMFTLEDMDSFVEVGIPGIDSLQLTFQVAGGGGLAVNYDIFTSYLYDRVLSFTGASVEIS